MKRVINRKKDGDLQYSYEELEKRGGEVILRQSENEEFVLIPPVVLSLFIEYGKYEWLDCWNDLALPTSFNDLEDFCLFYFTLRFCMFSFFQKKYSYCRVL